MSFARSLKADALAAQPAALLPAALQPTTARPSLRDSVIALRDSTEEVFLQAGTQLIEVATLLDAAKTAALSLDQLAKTDLLDRLRIEADKQSADFTSLAAEFGGTLSSIGALTSALGVLGKDLHDVRRSVLTMRIVVLNARVTLASLHGQDQRLSIFAESGQTVVAETSELLVLFETAMTDIRKAVEQTREMVDRISATLKTEVQGAFRSLMTSVAGFESGVRAVSARGAELSRSIQAMLDATGHAVSGLQIGDSTRQRLDHIAFILSPDFGDEPHLRALAAALLRDTAQAHEGMLDQLRSSVSRMITGVSDLVETHLAGFLGSRGETASAPSLADDSGRLVQAVAALQPMQERTQALGQVLTAEFETFRGLISQGEGVQHSTRLIGINAVLSCMRLGQDGAALKVVAEQLQVVSSEVGGRFATIRNSLETFSRLGGKITTDTEALVRHLIEVPERLTGSFGTLISTAVAYVEPVEQAVARLGDRLSGLDFDFGPALSHSHTLQDLAARTDATIPAQPSDHIPDAVLAQIYAVFTIEQERDTFRAILPDRADVAKATALGAPTEDLDDGFLF